MNKYKVTVEFESDVEVVVSAKNKREACAMVRKKVREGKIRAKLRPSKFSSYGSNIVAELNEWPW